MAENSDEQRITAPSSDWTDAELAAAVRAYLDMLRCELENIPYQKSKVNKMLREGPLASRTQSSVEFRMQNISATLFDLKIPHIVGYRPAKNVGSGVKERLMKALAEQGVAAYSMYIPTANTTLLDERVAHLRLKPLGKPPSGRERPESLTVITNSFVRDPAVKRWVLQTAAGNCEGCQRPAPFVGADGHPYLEVHHVVPLSSSGSDRISNAVALCPNCHRRCHFSIDRDEFKLRLYEAVDRLSVEVHTSDDLQPYVGADLA